MLILEAMSLSDWKVEFIAFNYMVDYIWAERQEYIFDNSFWTFVDLALCYTVHTRRATNTEKQQLQILQQIPTRPETFFFHQQ